MVVPVENTGCSVASHFIAVFFVAVIVTLSSAANARTFHLGALDNPALENCDKLYWSGQIEKANECYENLLSSGEPLQIKAEAAWALGEKQTANQIFGDARDSDPTNSLILSRWGDLYADSYQLQEALELYEEALQADENNSYADLGAVLVLIESGDSQAPSYLESLVAEPSVAPGVRLKTLITLSYLAVQSNDLDKAAQNLDLAKGLANNFLATELEYLAMRASLEVRRRADPTEWIDQALALNPSYGDIYAIPAYFYMISFNYDKTGEFYQKAVDIQPNHWAAHLGLGSNHLRQNRATAARKHFEISYEGDAFNPVAVNSLRLMDTYEELEVLNYPTSPDESLLPVLSLRLDKTERDILAPYASKLAQQAIDSFSQRYQFELKETAAIELYPNHDDFIVRSLGMPGAGLLGVAFGYLVAMDSPSAKSGSDYHWGTTLWHEVAHIFTLEASNHLVPRWFSEGISVFEEWQTGPIPGTRIPLYVYEALIENDFLPVDELDRGFVQPEYEDQVIVSYMQAGLICEYVDRTFGFDHLVKMLDGYKRGLNTEQVVEEIFDLSIRVFDNGFAQYFFDHYGGFLADLPDWTEQQKLAKQSFGAEQWDLAIAHADQAIAIHPTFTEANNSYLLKAAVYDVIEDLTAKMQVLEDYWKAGGYQLEPLKELAEYFAAHEREADAVAIFSGLNLVSPFELEVHSQLGDLFLEGGQPEKALIEYQVAMALDPLDKAVAHYQLASAYHQLGYSDLTQENLMAALQIAPHYKPAQRLLIETMK